MENNQTVCPRCGEATTGYGFCPPCRSQIDALKATAPSPAVLADDPTATAAQVLREVVRLEQALAATSKGISDRIAARTSAGAVQIEPASEPPAERTVLPGNADERDVARLEDVLSVAPPAPNAAAESVAPPSARPETSAPPRSVAPPSAEPETAAPLEPAPSFVAAQALREAFWFEQAAAFKPAPEGDPSTKPAPTPEPQAEPAPSAEAEPALPLDPEPAPAASVVESPADETQEHHWLAALCLIALIGLLIALTGRAPRRTKAG
jgi:hypothetical protein